MADVDPNHWTASYWHLDADEDVCADGPHRAPAVNEETADDEGNLDVPFPGLAFAAVATGIIGSGLALSPMSVDDADKAVNRISPAVLDFDNPDGGYGMYLASRLVPPIAEDAPKMGYGDVAMLVVIHQHRRNMHTHLQSYHDRIHVLHLDQEFK